jgi:allantoicase
MTSNEVNGVKSTSTPIPALLLTPEAFAPFGHVIQAYADPNSRPKGVAVAYANQGTAFVYKRVAPVVSSYPEGITPEPITAVSVFRSTPAGAQVGGIWDVKLLERHIYTNQVGLNTYKSYETVIN